MGKKVGASKMEQKSYKKLTFKNKKERLEKRAESKRIGGTSASVLFDENKHKSLIKLVAEIKYGKKEKAKNEDNKLILNEYNPLKYGSFTEPLLRKIAYANFLQNGLVVKDENINLYLSLKNDFQSASIDGSLLVKGANPYDLKINEKGILEIKTFDVKNNSDLEKWENKMPQNYFIQILHYLSVLNDFTFAFLVVKLRYFHFNDLNNRTFNKEEIRYYLIKKDDFKEDIEILEKKEKYFYDLYIKNNGIPEF